MFLLPAAALAGNIRLGVGGRRGAAGWVPQEQEPGDPKGLAEEGRQRPGTHSQAKLHLGAGAGLGEGWRRVRPGAFPACSHRHSQDVAVLPCAEQDS